MNSNKTTSEMFFWTLFFAITAVFVSSQLKDNTCGKGEQCKKTISMPLLDHKMKVSLKADLDVEYLESYIQQEIQKGLEIVKNMVKSETDLRIQKHLQDQRPYLESYSQQEIQKGLEIVKNMVKSETDLRIQKHLQDRQQYAFFATLSSNQKDLTGNEVVVFDVVPLNVGGAYSGTTGKFTCQDDGLYTFSWTTLSASKKDFTSVLTINGTLNVASNVVDNESTGDAMTGSSTVIVKLKKGDLVWLKVGTVGSFLEDHWDGPSSMFSGFKIN